MCGELFWSATFSRDSVEDRVDSILLCLAVEIPEVFEEMFPSVLRVFFQELVDCSILASGEFGFEK